MLAVSHAHADQVIRSAVLGAATELTAKRILVRRLGETARPYQAGRPGRLMHSAEVLTAAGLAGAILARRNRAAAVLCGVALITSSALTRFGVFEAGMASARDPAAAMRPQRERLQQRPAGGA